jgi:hypothetical protein
MIVRILAQGENGIADSGELGLLSVLSEGGAEREQEQSKSLHGLSIICNQCDGSRPGIIDKR